MKYIIAYSFLFLSFFISAQQVSEECASCFTCTQLMQCFGDIVCEDCDVTNEIQEITTDETCEDCIEVDMSDPLNPVISCGFIECEIVERQSTGYFNAVYSITDPTAVQTVTNPFKIVAAANITQCEARAQVYFEFPDMSLIQNGDQIYIRYDYQVLVNGVVYDGWQPTREFINNATGAESTRHNGGSAINRIPIILQPGDIVQAQQRAVIINSVDNNANFDEVVTLRNGHTKIVLHPNKYVTKN